MKLNTTTLVFGVALTVVAGLFSSTIFGSIGSSNNAQTSLGTAGVITGHVTTILTDANGNIKEYRQSDNQIVNNGENCVAKMLFGAAGGSTVSTGVCTGAVSDGFRYIGIGNYTTAVNGTNSMLGNEYSAAKGVTSLARGVATTTMTNSTGTDGSTTSFGKVVLAKTFTSSQSASQIVQESGLFNTTSVATGGMFARQTFTSITMNNGDSLTVQWTINIGGTTNALTP
ncbi:MAG: hypothetical protein EPO62_08950 [Candidatus Nitrosotenuis sp.]|nr:MAG: hypothetical protein EPO62_08950 [Candidatus Nitrosotenuis sp.]